LIISSFEAGNSGTCGACGARLPLRNQTIHDDIEDPIILASAIQTAQAIVLKLIATSNKLQEELCRRGYLGLE